MAPQLDDVPDARDSPLPRFAWLVPRLIHDGAKATLTFNNLATSVQRSELRS